jgi:hypothetical protein
VIIAREYDISGHALRPREAQAQFLGKFSPLAKPCNLPADGPESRFPRHLICCKVLTSATTLRMDYYI